MSEIAQILATLNRIESKVDSNHRDLLTRADRQEERLEKHMDEEEGEIATVMKIVHDNREESERRHVALIQSINSYMDKHSKLETAFIKTPDGQPDLDGHRDDHMTRKQFDEWTQDVKKDVAKGVAKASVLGFLTWLLYIVWEAFLRGPKA